MSSPRAGTGARARARPRPAPTPSQSDFVYFYGRSQEEIEFAGAGLSNAAASVGLRATRLERRLAAEMAAAVQQMVAYDGDVVVDMATLRKFTDPRRGAAQPAAASGAAHDYGDDDAEIDEYLSLEGSEGGGPMEPRLLLLLARLRSGIESELVQMRASANAMRDSMLDGVVQREVSLAIHRPNVRLVPEHVQTQAMGCFEAWLTGLARGPLIYSAMRRVRFECACARPTPPCDACRFECMRAHIAPAVCAVAPR